MPHRTVAIHLLTLALILTSLPATAQSPRAEGEPSRPPGAIPNDAEAARRIAAMTRRTLETLAVPPGLALAVVRDDRVLLTEGFGVRAVEAGLPVEADTPFYIASSTKSFTALLATILDHRGVLDLDTPVRSALPDAPFPEGPPVTLRRLLTHTSGLVNQPVVIRTAYTGDHDRAQLLDLVASTQVRRQEFDYSNLGYVLAGLVIDDRVEGTWKDALRREIFEPLGMDRTTASVERVRAEGWPLAATYTASPGGSEPIPFVKTDATMHPAGGLISSARDLARWLRFQLGEGRLDGRRLVPEEVVRATHSRHVEVDQKFYLFHRTGYALGWYISDYEGETLLHHFGSFEGFRAHVSFMPDRGLGVVALINETGHGFFVPDLVAASVYDLLLGKGNAQELYRARLDEMATEVARKKEALAEHRRERSRRTFDLSRPMSAYAGEYRSDLLGDARIAFDGEALRITVGVLESQIEPFTEPETVRVELPPGSGTVLRFRLGNDSAVEGFETQGVFFRRIDRGDGPPETETGGDDDE